MLEPQPAETRALARAGVAPASVAPPARARRQEEAPLLPRIAAGDRDAAQACIARYGALVWSLARRLSPTPSDAEDAVQEIFLDVWKSAARFDAAQASETAFVAMIARRRLVDRRRSCARRGPTEPLPAGDDLAPLDDGAPRAEICAEAAIASRALDRLRPEQRRVLLLATREGLSHDEIARALGMPLGTVKAHARRGLLALRDALFPARANNPTSNARGAS